MSFMLRKLQLQLQYIFLNYLFTVHFDIYKVHTSTNALLLNLTKF